ncbi:hypothetical protein C8J57DRAFT_1585676 [Mycena rebaudengoi]|nr:hypothetical protein C8J57DRAFT_1585676 [Mycena rebaudengoi]
MALTQFLCTSCKKPFPQSQLLSTLSHRSQLLDVVRSNRTPSDWEALHIRSVVDFAQSELSRYDTEISRLRSALEKLEADRDILHAYYDVCRGVLPPIQSLPAEVLLDIFALCSPKLSEYDASSNYREAPLMELRRLMKFPLLRLSQVCARWRRLVVDTPGLWSSIQGACQLWPGSKKEQILEILQTIMDRSGNLPLTIEIQTHPGHTLELARLAQSSERWVTVSFIGAVSHLRHISSVQGRLPLLKSLELRSWGTKRLALEAFAVAPRLTELRIGGSIEGLERLPLHQIRRLTMMSIWILNTQRPMSIIPHFTNLDTLDLRFYNGNNKLPLPAHDFHSLSLPISSLEIAFSDKFLPTHDRQLLEDLFACFTLPLLGTFRLTSQKYPTVALAWPHSEFLSLSFRSAFHSHLRVLDLAHAILSPNELSQLLQSFPSLESLAISDPPPTSASPAVVTDTLLHDLTPVRLVPHLWSIRLVTRLQFTDRVFLDFVCSRLGARPFATTVHWFAGDGREFEADVATHLRKLAVAGRVTFEARELVDGDE